MIGVKYEDVRTIKTTHRVPADRMSEPEHEMNASMIWTATVGNIGMSFNCTTGVEDPRAVWTSFIPIVADSNLFIYYFR